MNLTLRSASAALLSLCSLSLALLTAGCASSPTSSSSSAPADEPVAETEERLRTSYGDLRTTLDAPDADRWDAVRRSLLAGFELRCPGTLCGGGYTLTTVRLACSSTVAARKLKDCVWMLGGSVAYVDGTTGALTNLPRTFECHVPVAGTAGAMLDALEAAGAGALDAPLPGTGASFHDALAGCFAGVEAPPPPSPPAVSVAPGAAYAELDDVLGAAGDGADPDQAASEKAGATARASWADAKRHLADGFDDVCGDTFCEGDFPDIAAIDLACAVDRVAARVGHCAWSFGAAEVSVGPRGRLTANATARACDVAIDAPITELLAAFAGADPLHAALPGKSTSIYDALVGCL